MTTKKPTAKSTKKTSAKRKSASDAAPVKKTWLRWCFVTSLKLLLVGCLAVGIYAIYLDGKVRNTFEGQRWQVPVQVYGQVQRLTQGDKLNLQHLKVKLENARYKKVAQVASPGEYALSNTRIIIFQRAFDFGEGLEPESVITVDVQNQTIVAIYLDDVMVSQVKLEPVFIDRILPESKEDRVLVSLENVPEKLKDTLLLIEDRDFYFHHGVSITGILRALSKNIAAGRTVQGGSTLTQQLVKNMFLTREKTIIRKVNEALMALILEYRYSKDQLLEAYINEVYLGQHYANGIYGFGLASNFYFGKAVDQLNDAQMALLIGQVKGPSYYDPWRFPERAKKRRDLVLRTMFEKNMLSVKSFEHAMSSGLSVRKTRRLVKQQYPAYIQKVKAELSNYLSDAEQESGIRVFTGFSVHSQQIAEKTVAQRLALLETKHKETDLQAAMVVTDIESAEVRAIVGGRESGYAGFNRALHASRPIGSLIKPAVFLAALERYGSYNFATVLADKPITLTSDTGKKWQPKNYSGKYQQQVNLLDALVNSLNVPTVNLGMELGLDNVVKSLQLLGFDEPITARPSMILGAMNMSPWRVNQLYLPIANGGDYQRSHVITKIVSANGETLFEFNEPREARLSDNGAYLLDYALTQVAQRGTAKSLSWRLSDQNIAGKTGTTNDQRDSWFNGYDGKHLVTTWVGRDDNKATSLTGSSGAVVLFSDFMKKQGVAEKSIAKPESIAWQKFEQKSGNAVNENCANTITVPAVIDGLTLQPCLEKPPEKKSWFEKLFSE